MVKGAESGPIPIHNLGPVAEAGEAPKEVQSVVKDLEVRPEDQVLNMLSELEVFTMVRLQLPTWKTIMFQHIRSSKTTIITKRQVSISSHEGAMHKLWRSCPIRLIRDTMWRHPEACKMRWSWRILRHFNIQDQSQIRPANLWFKKWTILWAKRIRPSKVISTLEEANLSTLGMRTTRSRKVVRHKLAKTSIQVSTTYDRTETSCCNSTRTQLRSSR